ncbi:MAG: EAL domain-containing protein [Nitrospinae bacterium]|nr:EAL domain-containing protein [Nitrospinota bacterium]
MPKVLLIDDEKDVRENLKDMLGLNGFEVFTAEDGREGVYLAHRELPHVILCDILMPVLDGYDVLEAIRAYPPTSQIPFIFLSALADREHIRQGMNLGAEDFITKPFTETEVIVSIYTQLKKRSALFKSRLLVVEDEEAARANLMDILELNGFEAMGAADGREGLEIALREHPDLILCDVMMPGIDGYVMLDKLRSHKATEQTPFIFLTAVADRQNMRRGMNMGADDYLTKPYTEEEVLTAVHIRLRKQSEMESKREDMRHQIHLLKSYDSLTGLPNRSLLKSRLDTEILWSRNKNTMIAGICLSINRFRSINEAFSHEVGDLILQQVASRLLSLVPRSATVARTGSDQFYLVIPINGRAQVDEVITLAMLASLSNYSFKVRSHDIHLTASIGLVSFPDNCSDSDSMLENAYIAMSYIKEHGPGSHCRFNPNMTATAINRMMITNEIRHAIEKNELLLHYQPQVEMSTGRIVCVEALLRWKRGEGLVSPSSFIPIAEETKLIIPIGEWALREACRQACQWHNAGFKGLRVAVNISSVQLCDKALKETVSNILRETGLAAHFLELEPTESSIMNNITDVIAILKDIKSMGVLIAIDDFGTGYSSFGYLNQLPLDKLKIDQLFIQNIVSDSNALAIMQTIIALGHKLNLKVIAEGVENTAQMDILLENGCDEIQGYYYSRPLPPAEMELLLKDKKLFEPFGD